jgi:hypothetical protein
MMMAHREGGVVRMSTEAICAHLALLGTRILKKADVLLTLAFCGVAS